MKTLQIFLTTLVMLTFCIIFPTLVSCQTATPQCLNTGDTNGDWSITATDAQMTFQIVLGLITPTYEQACAANCNGDSTITAANAQSIFFVVLGIGNCMDPLITPTPTPANPKLATGVVADISSSAWITQSG